MDQIVVILVGFEPRNHLIDPVKIGAESDMPFTAQRADMVDMRKDVFYAGRLIYKLGNKGDADDPVFLDQRFDLVIF